MTATTAHKSSFQPAPHSVWEPRRATTLAAARKRTRFVRLLRMALVGLASVIIFLMAAQILIRSLGGEAQEAVTVGEDARMINPRFTGRDEAGMPYVVTADAAIRRRGTEARLTELESPRLDYDLIAAYEQADGVLARTGVFDADARTLDLNSDVQFRTQSGYAFEADHARIYLTDERVVGNSPVEGEGPLGTIRADSYEVLDGGNRVVFRGNVRATIYNDAANDGDQP
jgi:lipopolysaccharide export system protein LptC